MKEFFISCEESLEQIDPACCGVAVGSSSPGCAASLFLSKERKTLGKKKENKKYYKENGLHAAKGAGVHRLKGHASWVQNGVSQFGLYLLEVFLTEGKEG